MSTQREVKDALPSHISYYSFSGDEVLFNDRRSTPGKSYLDPQDVLVRVYNATIAKDGGFSGEVVALGDHVDSFGMNDYVFGGGQPCLQRYITVKASEISTKPKNLPFAEASHLYAGHFFHDALQHLQEQQMVLILGDFTGFAVQICREKGCFVTSSENFHCGEENIIDSDDFVGWLAKSKLKFDVVVDATGDMDLYEVCHEFTVRTGEYISIQPQNSLQAATSSIWPSFLGGGKRKLTIARAAKGEKRSLLLTSLAAKVINQDYEVKSTRIIDFESVKNVPPAQRYITAVNIIKQSELTPDEPDPVNKEGRASGRRDKGKGSADGRVKRTPQTPEGPRGTHGRATSTGTVDILTGSPMSRHGSSSPILGSSPVANPYSPRQPSRLSHSISASNLSDLERTSPSPPSSAQIQGGFSPPQRALSFGHRITSPLLGSQSPARSPKMSILARPPLSRRHTSGPANFDSSTGSPFDSVDLQAAPSTTRIQQEPVGEEEKTGADESMTASEIKELELSQAREQIEALQRQVELLMASKAAEGKDRSSGDAVQGLGLTLA